MARELVDEGYDPIEDWSLEGRRDLIENRGDEIRLLLDLAFSSFVDEHPAGLVAFGFHADDAVQEALTWVVDRFVSGDLDVARLRPEFRGFRLFTAVRFWLCQKVGKPGYARIMGAASTGVAGADTAEGEGRADRAAAMDSVEAFGGEIAGVLHTLLERTCPDIVGFWLEGTKSLRRDWFGWRKRGEISAASAALSKKQRSIYAHDAMFRFLCCFHRLVPAAAGAVAERALELTTLSGCPNHPPYRVPDRSVVQLIEGASVRGPREVARLRKAGARRFLQCCLDHAAREGALVARDHLVAELTQTSLGLTTLHALGLEEDRELRGRLEVAWDRGSEEGSH